MKTNFALAATLITIGLSSPLVASTVQWVNVGDAGNLADTNGLGAVPYAFQISKFEFTNAQYTAFLNAVDQTGANQYSLYATTMSGIRSGINFVSTNANGSKYVVKANFGDKPVNFVNWFDAARVANWMHNGATIGASTETGAYTLNGATTGSTIAKNAGARFWIPSQDEWYKAAYYKGGSTNAGYWEYATESETAPLATTATSTGVGNGTLTGNTANFNNQASWNTATGNVTSVGTNGRDSAYGAYDMGGNVREIVSIAPGTNTMVRGGAYSTNAGSMSATTGFASVTSVVQAATNGFRLATAVPEPGSTLPILTLFGLALSKSRRRRKA